MQPQVRKVVDVIGDLKVLDRVGKVVGDTFDRFVSAGSVKDALAGTWLGHPLHPVLTDIPIGAWSSAFFLDYLGGKKARSASDALIGIGILSAIPTAVSGLADWTDTWGKTQRVGVAHALGNLAPLRLFPASPRARRRGQAFPGLAPPPPPLAAAGPAASLGGPPSLGRGGRVPRTAVRR